MHLFNSSRNLQILLSNILSLSVPDKFAIFCLYSFVYNLKITQNSPKSQQITGISVIFRKTFFDIVLSNLCNSNVLRESYFFTLFFSLDTFFIIINEIKNTIAENTCEILNLNIIKLSILIPSKKNLIPEYNKQ